MIIERLEPFVKEALADRLDTWELIEYLEIPIEDLIEIFEDEIIEKLPGVLDLAGILNLENDNDNEQ